MKELVVTENHIKLLKSCYVDWNPTEFGGPCVDPKRPFGNSDVIRDMANILGMKLADYETDNEKYKRQCASLIKGYHELQECLQILISNLKIEPGKYARENEYDAKSWKKVD